MKKFSCEYNHMGKRYVMYFRAYDFEHAREQLNDGFRNNRIDRFEFAEQYTDEQKKLRLRDAYYNGELGKVVLTIPLPF